MNIRRIIDFLNKPIIGGNHKIEQEVKAYTEEYHKKKCVERRNLLDEIKDVHTKMDENLNKLREDPSKI